MRQNLTNAQRAVLRRSTQQSNLWGYVEPVSLSSSWVHFDMGFRTSVCSSGGYPLIRQGSRGLTVDDIIGCNTWCSLQENVVGTGKTSTTID